MSKHYIIPIFVPHLGCPHDCIFCNQKKIASSITNITEKDIEDTIERYLSYFKKDSFIEIAFYGGSFTAIDLEMQKRFLSIALKYKENNIINEIRLSTRPDSIDEFILNHLKEYKVDTIELGVQSLNDEVLYKSGRGHLSSDVYKSVKLIKEYNFNLGLQMMLGLPGDTLEKSIFTAKTFIDLEPDCVRIYPTLVIKDTYLEEITYKKEYTPLSLEEAVFMCTPILMDFYTNNINVIRVGLQPTENIQMGKDVVAGPFHPAFKQLVDANIYKNLLEKYIDNKLIDTKDKLLNFYINPKKISNLAGQKSTNIKFFKTKYGFKNIKIYSKDIDPNRLIINIDDYCDNIDIDQLMKDHIMEI